MLFCIHYKDYYDTVVKVIGWVTYILLYRVILFIWVVNYFCFMYGVGKFYLQLLLLNIFNSNVVFSSFEFEFDETFVMDSIGVLL